MFLNTLKRKEPQISFVIEKFNEISFAVTLFNKCLRSVFHRLDLSETLEVQDKSKYVLAGTHCSRGEREQGNQQDHRKNAP
jgi:hypothetical protein